MIGDKFKVAKSEEDIDRIRTNLLTAEEKQYVLWCYEKSGKFLPDPSMKLSDPEQYEKEIEYYTGSLARLGIELAYMGEMPKSKEVYQQAINLNSDQKTIVKLWGDYAEGFSTSKQIGRQRRSINDSSLHREVDELSSETHKAHGVSVGALCVCCIPCSMNAIRLSEPNLKVGKCRVLCVHMRHNGISHRTNR